MTARVLVVDDLAPNVRLLEAILTAHYFQVSTAASGLECLAKVEAESPDIVLLDVMMPGIDGFEVCRRIKSNPVTAHIPVVMVTALGRPSDRVTGLESGADDFLTKPVDDIALLARVRSLVRQKMLVDELRLRESTAQRVGLLPPVGSRTEVWPPSRILLVEDRRTLADCLTRVLPPAMKISSVETSEDAIRMVREEAFDLVLISLTMAGVDGLRLCSQVRALDQGRQLPILVVSSEDQRPELTQALEIGVNDYLTRPTDQNELVARVRTQLRKKHYADRLRHGLQLSFEMAITDELTGLHNRRFMSHHLDSLVTSARVTSKPLAFVILDIDLFKSVNDNHGHDIGDEVLKEVARRVEACVRESDLSCRYGGEEFVVVMPDTNAECAFTVAERLRKSIESAPIKVSREPGALGITVSIGVSALNGADDNAKGLLHRADQALYRAKHSGRNRVIADAA